MNERTHLFIKIYLSHVILERDDVGCVWEISRRRGQTAILTQQYFFLILAGLLNHASLRVQALCLELVLTPLASYLQLTFSKYPNSQPIASGHDVIHTPVSFTLWGLSWQLWLTYPLRTNEDCTQCLCTWTKSRIVQSPTKLNAKIPLTKNDLYKKNHSVII